MMDILYGYKFFPDQIISYKLSFAVFLLDDYTGKKPIGRIKVSLEGVDGKSVRNRSGYYLFLNLTGVELRIRVTADYYFSETIPLKLSDLDPEHPVVDIMLKPTPFYPFPSGTTLIRGMARDRNNKPVPGARVKIPTKGISARTTDRGEFVLYLKGIKEEDIIDKKFIKGYSGKTIRLEAAYELMSGSRELKGVKEGCTTSLKKPIILIRNK